LSSFVCKTFVVHCTKYKPFTSFFFNFSRILELEDVEAYEELSRQLYLELVDFQNTAERIEDSKTLKGRWFNFLGYFFSLYCAYKIVMCTVNIIFDRVGKKDPITLASEIIVTRMGLKSMLNFGLNTFHL